MKKVLRVIEVIVQIATFIVSLFAIGELVKHYIEKKKLKQKASEYLEDEFVMEANLNGPVAVYSPSLKENKKRITTLLAATGVGCVVLVVIKILKEA